MNVWKRRIILPTKPVYDCPALAVGRSTLKINHNSCISLGRDFAAYVPARDPRLKTGAMFTPVRSRASFHKNHRSDSPGLHRGEPCHKLGRPAGARDY